MVQIFKDTYEDLTPASLEKLIDDLAAGRKVEGGPADRPPQAQRRKAGRRR